MPLFSCLTIKNEELKKVKENTLLNKFSNYSNLNL
jgi:hypothetical protein